MFRKLKALFLSAAITVAAVPAAQAADFVDFARASRLIEVDVHALGGMSSVIQNYQSKFPQIQNLNQNLGGSFGLGFRAVFGVRGYLGFGTALDIVTNTYNIDMAVIGSDKSSMSAVFIDNRNFYANIPVFVSFRFNVDRSVRWSVDAGLYYAYGFAGTQKQRIYRAETNAMNEMVPQFQYVRTDYFHSPATFINAYNRGDLGLHLATGINFGPHLVVGVRYQLGIKNSSRSIGVINPGVHNQCFHGVVGYRF